MAKENIYANIEEKTPIIIGISTTNRSLNYDDIYCEIGYPYDDFRGVSSNNTICVAAGYSWPLKRLEVLKNKASRFTMQKQSLGLSKINVPTLNSPAEVTQINTRDLILNFLNN